MPPRSLSFKTGRDVRGNLATPGFADVQVLKKFDNEGWAGSCSHKLRLSPRTELTLASKLASLQSFHSPIGKNLNKIITRPRPLTQTPLSRSRPLFELNVLKNAAALAAARRRPL